jgi:hypothetical protein
MKKNLPLYLYGTIIIGEGILLILSGDMPLQTLKFSLGIGLIIGAFFAFLTAFSRQRKQVQFAYHEIHALTMLVYGVSILFFCNTLEALTNFTAFLLIFYAFSEIIFCNWLFNLGKKVLYKIVVIRLLLGLLTGIGTFLALSYTHVNIAWTIAGFGVLFILIGANIVLYVPIIQHEEVSTI